MKIGILIIATVLAYAAAPAADEVLEVYVIDGETARLPAHTVAPQYPRKARRDRVEGKVSVCFDIDRAGRPRRIAVRNSTHRTFEKPSIIAVRASFFRPLGENQPLQSMKACRTFIFSLVPIDEDDVLASELP